MTMSWNGVKAISVMLQGSLSVILNIKLFILKRALVFKSETEYDQSYSHGC